MCRGQRGLQDRCEGSPERTGR
ncbi:hypothetical protein STRTUCAR8_03362, partial [Streptomyces turgidiscabies Car8]